MENADRTASYHLYLYSPRGAAYTPTSLRARWHRWLGSTDAGIELCKHWRVWIAQQVARYEWEIDAANVEGADYPRATRYGGTCTVDLRLRRQPNRQRRRHEPPNRRILHAFQGPDGRCC